MTTQAKSTMMQRPHTGQRDAEHRGKQSRHMDQRDTHSATDSKQEWSRVHCEAVYFGNDAEVKKKDSCTFSEMSTQFQQYFVILHFTNLFYAMSPNVLDLAKMVGKKTQGVLLSNVFYFWTHAFLSLRLVARCVTCERVF